MDQAPLDQDGVRSPAATRRGSLGASPGRAFRRPLLPVGMAERVALGMIARHGANAAREVTVHLNRMIDRGDLAARDLWACVVHIIHERRR